MPDQRGRQIATWLEGHGRPAAHVVLDDLDLGISDCGHPFVRTDGKVGLTDDDASLAIEFLEAELRRPGAPS